MHIRMQQIEAQYVKRPGKYEGTLRLLEAVQNLCACHKNVGQPTYKPCTEEHLKTHVDNGRPHVINLPVVNTSIKSNLCII